MSKNQIVYLPYVTADNPDDSYSVNVWRVAENLLLERVKEALDEAGVAWIDTRTKEHSKPADEEEDYYTVHYQVINGEIEVTMPDKFIIAKHHRKAFFYELDDLFEKYSVKVPCKRTV